MERPHRLGVVSRLYPELTATFLTEALRNIYYADSKPNKFQSTDSTYFELTEQLTNILMLELNSLNCLKILKDNKQHKLNVTSVQRLGNMP